MKMNRAEEYSKDGYKQSPLGLIPDDWEVKRLGEVCTHFKSGITITSKKIQEKGQYAVYGGNGFRGYTDMYTHDGEYILIGRQGALCGNICFVTGRNYVSEHAIAVQTSQDIIWLKYKLIFWDLNRFSESSAQPGLSVEKLIRFQLSIPPLAEQRKIAEVLSTWDKAIELQADIIDKLTLRKKGLMQQLLTGKKRLKGFSDIYNLSSLKGLIDEVSARNGKLEGIPVLSVTNTRGFVSQLEQFDKEVASEDNSNYKIVCKGQFAYNPSRINVGSIDILRTFERGLLSPMYVVFKVNERKLSADYLCQQLKSWRFIGHISNYVQGSVRDSLSFDGLCSMKFFIPSIKEQNAIAEILSSADREIEKEKKKLEALKQQKKGLMQQLLTGKKRVVV